jgi:hypothetical protein
MNTTRHLFLTLALLGSLNACQMTPGSSSSLKAESTQATPAPTATAKSTSPSLVSVDQNGSTTLQTKPLADLLQNTPTAMLSAAEKNGLLMMREEEKLAHDVYNALYARWQMKIFNNIAQSELTHTEAVKALLDKYDLADPASASPGVFSRPEFNTLYAELISEGSTSLTAALQTGAKIEDLDIKDLHDLLQNTQASDIQAVYQELLRGSRNHIRAFARQLNNQGASYQPVFISKSEYEAIINSDMERGSRVSGG